MVVTGCGWGFVSWRGGARVRVSASKARRGDLIRWVEQQSSGIGYDMVGMEWLSWLIEYRLMTGLETDRGDGRLRRRGTGRQDH